MLQVKKQITVTRTWYLCEEPGCTFQTDNRTVALRHTSQHDTIAPIEIGPWLLLKYLRTAWEAEAFWRKAANAQSRRKHFDWTKEGWYLLIKANPKQLIAADKAIGIWQTQRANGQPNLGLEKIQSAVEAARMSQHACCAGSGLII